MELAWAAGFFDGEGCVSLTRNRDRRPMGMQFSVGQVDERPLRRLRAALDLGSITIRKTMPRNGKRLPMILSINRQDDIRAALEMLWPFLSEPKREQAARCYWAIAEAFGSRLHLPRDVTIRAAVSSRGGNPVNRTKTHCPQGHPYDRANTYWFAQKTGTLGRACRVCRAAHLAASKARSSAGE